MKKSKLFVMSLILGVLLAFSIQQDKISQAKDDTRAEQEIKLEIGYFIFLDDELWGPNVEFKLFTPKLPDLSKYERLISTEYRMFYKDKSKASTSMFLNLNFESHVSDEVVNNVSREILQIFNHTMLETLYKSGPIYKNTTVGFLYTFGTLPYSMETVLNFLRYKPDSGFGKLINEDFPSMYIPGNATTGMVYLAYQWEKGQGWHLIVESSLNTLWSPGKKIVNLNELLRNEKSINATNGMIKVFIWNWTLGKYNYIFRISSVSPSGYIEKKNQNSITYGWTVNDSIQNVIIYLETAKTPKPRNNLIIYATVIAVGVTIAIIIIVYTKLKKTSKEMRSTKL